MQVGLPVELLGPVCATCTHRHHGDEEHVRVLTPAEVDAMLALMRAGVFPDKGVLQ